MVGVVVGVAVSLSISASGSPTPSVGDRVLLASGASIGDLGLTPGAHVVGAEPQIVEDLPLTVAEAAAADWRDPALCSPGRGRYFYKDPAEQGVPYFLMYDNEDQLIGIYLFTEAEIPLEPWKRMQDLLVGGRPIIDFEHWGMFVYFRDPARACTTKSGWQGDASGRLGRLTKSTPTPYLPPTPTPTTGAILETTASLMASLKSLSFVLTAEPEGTPLMAGVDVVTIEGVLQPPDQVSIRVTGAAGTTETAPPDSLPFNFADLGVTLSGIAGVLQDPVDTTGQWIDNVHHRGISGTLPGTSLSALIPSAVPDATVTVQMWVGADGLVRRVRMEGPVAPDDPSEVVRVLELWD